MKSANEISLLPKWLSKWSWKNWRAFYSCPRDGHIYCHYEFEDWSATPRHCMMCGTAEPHRTRKLKIISKSE